MATTDTVETPVRKLVAQQLHTACRAVFGKGATKKLEPCWSYSAITNETEVATQFEVVPRCGHRQQRKQLEVRVTDGQVRVTYRMGYVRINESKTFDMADPDFQRQIALFIRTQTKTFFPVGWDVEEE